MARPFRACLKTVTDASLCVGTSGIGIPRVFFGPVLNVKRGIFLYHNGYYVDVHHHSLGVRRA